jgi:hypothetical protein
VKKLSEENGAMVISILSLRKCGAFCTPLFLAMIVYGLVLPVSR